MIEGTYENSYKNNNCFRFSNNRYDFIYLQILVKHQINQNKIESIELPYEELEATSKDCISIIDTCNEDIQLNGLYKNVDMITNLKGFNDTLNTSFKFYEITFNHFNY